MIQRLVSVRPGMPMATYHWPCGFNPKIHVQSAPKRTKPPPYQRRNWNFADYTIIRTLEIRLRDEARNGGRDANAHTHMRAASHADPLTA